MTTPTPYPPADRYKHTSTPSLLTAAQTAQSPIAWLKADHDRLFHLMDTFFILPATSHAHREALVDELVRSTSKHASAEERVIYPLIRDRLPNGGIVYERNVSDDQINKEYLSLLHKMRSERDGDLFDRSVDKFRMIEREHLSIEEEFLDQLDALLSAEERPSVYKALIAAWENAPVYPHPDTGPSRAPFANVVHPVAGLVDKAYDYVRGGRPAEKLED
ncbi:uncharacterized protein EV422DRAFT_567869 [Fimicolochytrium jonesii]|uniref:uncharacterized protein n=1 Tax=Fimicolochytrium jonesii TaxID=1396493 RepID=UPI0022FDBB4C|nr:uncharacterized protein EV422DRAFT_567869 [Fimicolochytrium jonesii]KAI8820445.1 hypothetical protein EV422DRAFT_567869 [Fimicolochytrium jonesii]